MDGSYTKKDNSIFERGEWWYIRPNGNKERMKSHAGKNLRRMFINGMYIKRSEVDPDLYKAGNWKSWEHATISMRQLKKSKKGYVYAITNDAWKGWVKVGQAVKPEDRLKQYQTSSPFRDYKLNFSIFTKDKESKEKEIHKQLIKNYEFLNEWFKIDLNELQEVFNDYSKN